MCTIIVIITALVLRLPIREKKLYFSWFVFAARNGMNVQRKIQSSQSDFRASHTSALFHGWNRREPNYNGYTRNEEVHENNGYDWLLADNVVSDEFPRDDIIVLSRF